MPRSADIDESACSDHIWRSLAVLGSSPSSTGVGILLAVDSQLLLVGGQAESKQSIYVAETRTGATVASIGGRLDYKSAELLTP